jgi:hypothetical protein
MQMSDTFYPPAHRAAFLNALFANSNGSLLELRLITDQEDERRRKHADRVFVNRVDALLAHLPPSGYRQFGHGVFVGVCPRAQTKGNKVSVKAAGWLWADLDEKDFPGGKAEALRRLEAFPLRYTMLTDTGHGYHAFWRLTAAVPTRTEGEQQAFERYLKRLCLHLGGDWAVCELARVMRVPGSWNIKDPNDPLPVRLLDLDLSRSYDLAAFEAILPQLPDVNGSGLTDNAPGWVANVLKDLQQGKRDDCHTAFGKVIGKFVESGFGVEDILTLLTPHLAQVAHADHRFSLEDLREEVEDMARRYPAKAAHAKPSPTGVFTAQFEGLVDLVEHEGKVAFLVKEGEQLLILPEAERDGTRYLPPPKEQRRWLLPRGEEVLRYARTDTDAALYDDLLAYHRSISELPGEGYYDLVVAWDFHTYLLEQFQYTPILWLFAVPERGKSRTGKGIIYVAYRGAYDQSMREANFLRLASHHQASVFFDITNLWRTVQQNQSEDVLLHRFERGGIVSRVLYPDRGAFRDTVHFTVFGATVIATNHGVPEVLQTRALQINMPDSDRPFDAKPTPEAALPLKERLVAFRARHLGNPLPVVPKSATRRLGDILEPLHQIIRLVRPDREAIFLRLAKSLEEERQTEKADSLEAHILEAMLELGSTASNGRLAVKKITEAYNAGRSPQEQMTTKSIGWRLKAIGLKKVKTRDGAMIVWDAQQLARLGLTYGVQGFVAAPDISGAHPDEGGNRNNPLEQYEGPV